METLERDAVAHIRQAALPLTGDPTDYDALLELVGDARLTLLGEASHGTHEFYRERAEITKRLIREKSVTAVVVEADWPDAYRVNRYVRGEPDDDNARTALSDFQRFPMWMWRNTVVVEFVEWLRDYNDSLPAGQPKTGFYGMDLYSLNASIEAVLAYLDQNDPAAARRARERYSCFERFEKDAQAYGYAASSGIVESCEDAVVAQLVDMQLRAGKMTGEDGGTSASARADEQFAAEQNARLAVNAEQYYRAMFRGRDTSWNLRDQHMAETLAELMQHQERLGTRAKLAVWAHNSHLGDARATEMGARGELNVGQLVRERWGDEARLIGFTTYTGTVTAADNWDEPPQLKRVRRGMSGSYEALFHELGEAGFYLPLRASDDQPEARATAAALRALRRPMLERAIGVIYRPETERWSHYFRARLADQFDAVLHFDWTQALVPLERSAEWDDRGEAPETYPVAV